MTTLCIGGKVGIGYQILYKWLVKFWCLLAPKYVKSRKERPILSSKGHLIHFCQIVLKFVGTSSNDKYILCLFGFWGEEVVEAWWDLITLRGKTQIMCNSFPKSLYNTYWFDLICHEQKPFPTHWKYVYSIVVCDLSIRIPQQQQWSVCGILIASICHRDSPILFMPRATISLLDNAPNYLFGCVIQKSIRDCIFDII